MFRLLPSDRYEAGSWELGRWWGGKGQRRCDESVGVGVADADVEKLAANGESDVFLFSFYSAIERTERYK